METLELSVHAPEPREQFFESIYETAFPAFARFAAKMNASFDDAKDVFQDAMVVYYEKSNDPKFLPRTTPEAYVLGIARHLWLKRFKRQRSSVSLEREDSEFAVPADFFPDERELSLLSFVAQSGQKCLDLLQKFYFEKTPLKEIAAFLGYRTEHSAAVQKYKCIGKLRDAIKANSIRYEDFHF